LSNTIEIHIFAYIIMNKKRINKALIVKSIAKMVSDKKAIRSYIKGNTDFRTIKNKGIKFASPI